MKIIGFQEKSKWKSPKREIAISKLHPPTLKYFKIPLKSTSRSEQWSRLKLLNSIRALRDLLRSMRKCSVGNKEDRYRCCRSKTLWSKHIWTGKIIYHFLKFSESLVVKRPPVVCILSRLVGGFPHYTPCSIRINFINLCMKFLFSLKN